MSDSIFTKIIKGEIPGHKIYEDEMFIAILDIFPQSPGHSLLIPKKQEKDLFELSDDIGEQIIKTSRKIANTIMSTLKADGIKIVQNNGATAGQTVWHYHMHIIPSYKAQIDIKKDEFEKIQKLIIENL